VETCPACLAPCSSFVEIRSSNVAGLALNSGNLLDVSFARSFLRGVLSAPKDTPSHADDGDDRDAQDIILDLEDLGYDEPELATSLTSLLAPQVSDRRSVTAAQLDALFVANARYGGGEVHVEEVELCEGGKDRAVTEENKREYVALLLQFTLRSSVQVIADRHTARTRCSTHCHVSHSQRPSY